MLFGVYALAVSKAIEKQGVIFKVLNKKAGFDAALCFIAVF
ncbi:hypothetical protein [Oceanisphaera psychrotolerans]|nr:hypothetical protein [Oceanisphaera psychrotolerans]